MVDYHVHVLSHGEYDFCETRVNNFIDQACSQGIQEIGFSEHNQFFPRVDLNIFQTTKIKRQNDIELRLGIEVDYIPGLEDDQKKLVARPELDYTIGSVHFIDGWAFDHPDYKHEFSKRDIDETYARYAEILISMVKAGLFDIVGHLDLVKIWGDRPRQKDPAYYIEPVLNAIQKSDMAVEINSAGLRKPVAEQYPAADLVQMMFERNIPIIFGSDAHNPEQVGEGLQQAYSLAWSAGYRSLVKFNRHVKTVSPIRFK